MYNRPNCGWLKDLYCIFPQINHNPDYKVYKILIFLTLLAFLKTVYNSYVKK